VSKFAGIQARALTYPNDVRAQISAAYACQKEGKVELSMRYFDAAAALGLPIDGRYDFYFAYGSALRDVGRLQESEEVLRFAIQEFPKDKGYPVYLAMTLDKAGKNHEAVAELLELLVRLRDKVVDLAPCKEEMQGYLTEIGRPPPKD
jgi:tetratricopeptide (TPR) repeat protein